MSRIWFYQSGSSSEGPHTLEEIRDLIVRGLLHANSNVYNSEVGEWTTAGKVPDFFPTPVPGGQIIPDAQPVVVPVEATAQGVGFPIATFAVRVLCEGAGWYAGRAVEGILDTVAGCFRNQSERVTLALQTAGTRSWDTIELALKAEPGFFARLTHRADSKSLAEPLRTTFAAIPGDQRQKCLEELSAARARGLLHSGSFHPQDLVEPAQKLLSVTEPAQCASLEWEMLKKLTTFLSEAGYPNLAQVTTYQIKPGEGLLVTLSRYFFRQTVAEDQILSNEWSFLQLEQVQQTLEQQDQRAEVRHQQLVNTLGEIGENLQSETLRLDQEQRQQSDQLQQLYQWIAQLESQFQLQGNELPTGKSVSINLEKDRQQVRTVVAHYRGLSAEERRARPALLNAVGKLEAASGDIESANRDFQEVASLVQDREAQAEAHHNRYQAFLESGRWDEALEALQKSAELSPERYAPFPQADYEPKRILGVGGFGVTILCLDRIAKQEVAIKTLKQVELQNFQQIITEAQVLMRLNHPSVIRVLGRGYADNSRTRLYLAQEFFSPTTLEQHVRERGTLSEADFLSVARQIAEGMKAAHDQGVLHRDLKPANVLIQKKGEQWQIRIIDFGLAMQEGINKSISSSRSQSGGSGQGITGTLEFAAPEQLGKAPGVKVGTWSDVYGFGKTCCFALFGSLSLGRDDWDRISRPLGDLLGACTKDPVEKRPQTFDDVLSALAAREEKNYAVLVEPLEDPATEKETGWLYVHQGQQSGPVPTRTIQQLLSQGKLLPQDRVWSEGMSAWQPVASLPQFQTKSTHSASSAAPPRPPANAGQAKLAEEEGKLIKVRNLLIGGGGAIGFLMVASFGTDDPEIGVFLFFALVSYCSIIPSLVWPQLAIRRRLETADWLWKSGYRELASEKYREFLKKICEASWQSPLLKGQLPKSEVPRVYRLLVEDAIERNQIMTARELLAEYVELRNRHKSWFTEDSRIGPLHFLSPQAQQLLSDQGIHL